MWYPEGNGEVGSAETTFYLNLHLSEFDVCVKFVLDFSPLREVLNMEPIQSLLRKEGRKEGRK